MIFLSLGWHVKKKSLLWVAGTSWSLWLAYKTQWHNPKDCVWLDVRLQVPWLPHDFQVWNIWIRVLVQRDNELQMVSRSWAGWRTTFNQWNRWIKKCIKFGFDTGTELAYLFWLEMEMLILNPSIKFIFHCSKLQKKLPLGTWQSVHYITLYPGTLKPSEKKLQNS